AHGGGRVRRDVPDTVDRTDDPGPRGTVADDLGRDARHLLHGRRRRGADRPRRRARCSARGDRAVTTAVSVPSAFRRLLISTGVSSVGDGVRLIAMPWMATRFTSDPQLIAGVVVADRLPW